MACTQFLFCFAPVAAILEVSFWWQHYSCAAPVVTHIQGSGDMTVRLLYIPYTLQFTKRGSFLSTITSSNVYN